MKNSTRTVNFTVALMSALTVFYLIITRFTLEQYFVHAEIALAAMALFSILLIFPLVQAILRYFEIRPYYQADRLFIKVALGEVYIQQRALAYVLIVLTHFFTYLKTAEPIPKEAYIWALVWFVLFEATLIVTHLTTYAHVMSDSIIIKGFDLRMDLPLADPLISHSGIYSYQDFDQFETKGARFILHMPGKTGRVQLLIPMDKHPHMASFFSAKGLEFKPSSPRKQKH